MEVFELPILGKAAETPWPSPEEYTYWAARKNRVFYVDFEIDEAYQLVELSKVIIQMNMEEKDIENPDPIYLFIYSYGGDLEQTYGFCDLCISSHIPIITVNMGVAMSAGLLILLCGKKRYAFEHSNALIHSGSGGFSGTAEQIEEAQKNYKKQLGQMKDYIINRTSIDEKLFNKNRNKDWYLTIDEQVKYGVVDSVIKNVTEIL